ncbi:hypothetical protein L227DRAFT_379614 [Lentinus tigrinus ALCF2SS1-6]|uniref:Uncharacterized protein n=1 Tax=Lentinus tigrinus ALCF2SS1-6 TaxID=1328759 RepID=A0A5C2RR77_9APHY|nr:hypothetical protein L227DRAFT_379614 [Lentinus tigrinus ALCF2SS1-6]
MKFCLRPTSRQVLQHMVCRPHLAGTGFCHLRVRIGLRRLSAGQGAPTKTPRRTNRLSLSVNRRVQGMRYTYVEKTASYPITALESWRGKASDGTSVQVASPSRSSTGSVPARRLLPRSCVSPPSLRDRLRHTAPSSCSGSTGHDLIAHMPLVSAVSSAGAS